MSGTGNTYDKKSWSWGHARKVWRSIRHVYPGGGMIQNTSDFTSARKIPAGSPVKFDPKTKQITVILDSAIKAAVEVPETKTEAEAVAELGINGFLQEDVRLTDSNTKGSGTVVYAGELYEYMFDAEVVKKLKLLTNVPQIVWVQ